MFLYGNLLRIVCFACQVNPWTVGAVVAFWQLWSIIVWPTTSFFAKNCVKSYEGFSNYLKKSASWMDYNKNWNACATSFSFILPGKPRKKLNFLTRRFAKILARCLILSKNPRSWQKTLDNFKKCKMLAIKPRYQAVDRLWINSDELTSTITMSQVFIWSVQKHVQSFLEPTENKTFFLSFKNSTECKLSWRLFM